MVSRRTVLRSSGLGIAGFAGCTTLQRIDERIGDVGRTPPKRRVPMDWTPDEHTWPHSRYDPQNSRNLSNETLPSNSPSIGWQTTLDAPISSIVVAKGMVFVTTKTAIHGLAGTDGSPQWSHQIPAQTALKYVDGRLYELRTEGLKAQTPSGDLLWERSFDVLYDALDREGYVFVTHGNRGYSTLHANTGEIVRHRDTDIRLLAVDSHGIVTTRTSGVASMALNGRTLETTWEKSVNGPYEVAGFPVVANDRILVPERASSGADVPDGRVAIVSDSGDEIRTLQFDERPVGIAVADDVIVVGTATTAAGSLGAKGSLQAFDMEGNSEWTFEPNSGITPLAIANGRVVAGPAFGGQTPLVALDISTGDVLWKRSMLGSFAFAAIDQTLIVGEGHRLVAVE